LAERTVNVRINYTVNTAEIQKAQAASQAAQKATDDLRRASEQYGKASTAAHKENSAGAKLASHDVGSLSKEFNSLYSAIKLVISAGLARELFDATLAAAKLSGTIDGVQRAFNRIPNATLIMNQLRKATHGTVSDLELMQKALTAQNFRIPLEKLGTLLEFAAVKAQQTGQEVNHLVDYIVSGIGYRSIKRLDDLGFTANRVKEALGGVSLQAADMGQVMDAVTKLMAEDLGKTGGFAKTSATEVERLAIKWNALKVAVSEALTSPALLKFYEGTVDALKEGFNVTFGNNEKIREQEVKRAAAEEVESFKKMHLTKEVLKSKEKINTVIQKEIDSNKIVIADNEKEMAQLKERFAFLTDEANTRHRDHNETQEEIDRIKEQHKYYLERNAVLREGNNILFEYREELEKTLKSGSIPVMIFKAGFDDEASFREYKRIKKEIEDDSKKDEIDFTFKFSEEDAKRVQQEAYDFMKGELAKDDGPSIELADILFGPEKKRSTDWELLRDEFKENWRGILSQGFDDTANFLHMLQEAELSQMQNRITNIRNHYDNELLLAGDNERRKKEIAIKEAREIEKVRRDIAMKEWQSRRNGVLIDTAAGIAKNFAQYPWPEWIIPVAVTTAQGAAQLSAIDRARPRFAKGVLNLQGPGTGTSDSISAYLSKGESVMTADETRNSLGILKAIKENKIDDRILKNIDFTGGRTVHASLNDSRIVDELQAIRKGQYNIEEQGRQLFRVYSDRQGNKKRIRSKSI
jgi:hypothetical protein